MARKRALRLALGLAAGGLAAAAVSQVFALGRERSELLATARELEVARPELLRALRRADDPEGARTVLARELLAEAGQEDGAGEELRRARLREAERLARSVLARRPASWQAAMVSGAAPYLAWSLDRDPRLLQDPGRWQEPLLLARRLGPARPEPDVSLATAYLELWPALSDARRRLARELLGTAFQDPAVFDRLIDPWLEISDGDPAPVPDRSWAWERLQRSLAGSGDWAGFCRAWDARRSALQRELRAQLQGGLDLVDRKRWHSARGELFAVVAAAPRDRAFAPIVEEALEHAPFGPPRPELTPPLLEWLRWSQDHALRGPLPLSEDAVARLGSAVAAGGPKAPGDVALAAWAALAVGDLPRAERIERRAEGLWTQAWAPYWIEKARRLAARQRPEEAAAALDRVHPDQRAHPGYRAARRAVSSSGERSADDPAATRGAWPGTSWSWRQGAYRLEPEAAVRAPGLRVELLGVPSTGAAIEAAWDGASLGCRAVTARGALELDLPVTPGPHLLEVRVLASPPETSPVPGEAALLTARPPRLPAPPPG